MTKSAKLPAELKNRVLSPKQRNYAHFLIGELGEQRAAAYLRRKAYQIIETNVRFKNYEIDIVAFDRQHGELVFIEVKTRRTDWFGHPSQAVNRQKRRSLNQAARHYLRITGLRNCYRFDIISVTPGRVEHFENITWP